MKPSERKSKGLFDIKAAKMQPIEGGCSQRANGDYGRCKEPATWLISYKDIRTFYPMKDKGQAAKPLERLYEREVCQHHFETFTKGRDVEIQS